MSKELNVCCAVSESFSFSKSLFITNSSNFFNGFAQVTTLDTGITIYPISVKDNATEVEIVVITKVSSDFTNANNVLQILCFFFTLLFLYLKIVINCLDLVMEFLKPFKPFQFFSGFPVTLWSVVALQKDMNL